MATIVPFPRTRDRAFIERHARLMASYSPQGAERHLAVQLAKQRSVLAGRGVASEVIDEHIRALQTAIRAALWSLARTPRGTA
jgi:hypothetical protein